MRGEDAVAAALDVLEAAARTGTYERAYAAVEALLARLGEAELRDVAAAMAVTVTRREGEPVSRQFVPAVTAADVQDCRLRLAWAWST